MCKYIFVAGGLISGIGKGVCTASIGLLLKLRGINVTCMKFDGYGNVNCGLIRPGEHGNIVITVDGGECDLDISHYEVLGGISATKKNICTAGTLHKELIEEQESGKYLGQTIQTSHFTQKVQDRIIEMGKTHDVVIVEIGGTVGDNENFGFFEAIRQFKQIYRENVIIALVSPILWINTIKEFKTKPLQNSVKELQQYGIQPDIIFCRSDRQLPEIYLDKVANLTNVPRQQVFEARDVSSIYQVPLEFYDRQVDDLIVDLLRLPRSSCRIRKYRELVEKHTNNNLPTINIGIVVKYENEEESYLSIRESLVHAGLANDVKVKVHWIKAEELEKYKDMRGLHKYFEGIHGLIIGPGFDKRGVEGKIKAAQYAREKKIPLLGICLGLQCIVIEFARNVCGMENANSLEFDIDTPYPVIHFVEGQENLKTKSANMRLGSYDCELVKDSLAFEVYGNKLIKERHRHRFEVNPKYIDIFAAKGFKVTGINPNSNLVEIIELDRNIHPYYIGGQFHPEYQSRLMSPAPLFKGLIAAAIKNKIITSQENSTNKE